jgi:hypothetical protein
MFIYLFILNRLFTLFTKFLAKKSCDKNLMWDQKTRITRNINKNKNLGKIYYLLCDQITKKKKYLKKKKNVKYFFFFFTPK